MAKWSLFGSGKKINDYAMLEPVRVNLKKEMQNTNPKDGEYCALIATTSAYSFYCYMAYKDRSRGYILRHKNIYPESTVFFGKLKQMCCIYSGWLFQANHSGEHGDYFVQATNIETGEIVNYNWLGDGYIYVSATGSGRMFHQDSIEKMYLSGNKLILEITRKKSRPAPHEKDKVSTDVHDYDTTYRLEVIHKDGDFLATAYFPERTEDDSNTRKRSRSEVIAETICQYFWMKIDDFQKQNNLEAELYPDVCLWTMLYYCATKLLGECPIQRLLHANFINSMMKQYGHSPSGKISAVMLGELKQNAYSSFCAVECSIDSVQDIKFLCQVAFEMAYPEKTYDSIIELSLFACVSTSISLICELIPNNSNNTDAF